MEEERLTFSGCGWFGREIFFRFPLRGVKEENIMSSPSKRREMDIMKLLMADFNVSMCDEDRGEEFDVRFKGPKESKQLFQANRI